mmetsp:Transcript_38625/g.27957  ORF Transcript_38625/g.27957 Transcript_38625/m.27957 type:complete len:91 (+) Transcript_38625:1169-1441(+)
MRGLKRSILPDGLLKGVMVVARLPYIIGLLFYIEVSKHVSMVFSNVPGPKKPLKFCGINSQELAGLIPASGELANGFGALSHCNTLRLSF